MSCNGCRVLRKGCSENCMLRPCLQWIESAEAQGHATVFVAKFFGRAGLMSFISAVPENQRPGLFQSLLFEAAGRTVNPVNGAVGLLWTGNWHVCQAAVETVLRGGTLRPIQEFLGSDMEDSASDCTDMFKLKDNNNNTTTNSGLHSRSKPQKRRRSQDGPSSKLPHHQLADLDLTLTPCLANNLGSCKLEVALPADEKRRLPSPSLNSEESGTTTCLDSDSNGNGHPPTHAPKLLHLFM